MWCSLFSYYKLQVAPGSPPWPGGVQEELGLSLEELALWRELQLVDLVRRRQQDICSQLQL